MNSIDKDETLISYYLYRLVSDDLLTVEEASEVKKIFTKQSEKSAENVIEYVA